MKKFRQSKLDPQTFKEKIAEYVKAIQVALPFAVIKTCEEDTDLSQTDVCIQVKFPGFVGHILSAIDGDTESWVEAEFEIDGHVRFSNYESSVTDYLAEYCEREHVNWNEGIETILEIVLMLEKVQSF